MFFFFNDTATTEIYTLSLHDALPIYGIISGLTRGADGTDVELRIEILDLQTHQDSEFGPAGQRRGIVRVFSDCLVCARDRKSTRLNSSHSQISYAVFCLKKKTRHYRRPRRRCPRPPPLSGALSHTQAGHPSHPPDPLPCSVQPRLATSPTSAPPHTSCAN